MAKSWYIIHTYTGYEQKIERSLNSLLESGGLDSSIVSKVHVPFESVEETRGNKKYTRKSKLLPGYVMIEMDLPEKGWKDTCSTIKSIEGVTGFPGVKIAERPRPISKDEATILLTRSGAISGEMSVQIKRTFAIGDSVKVTEGSFAGFNGKVTAVDDEKSKLTVNFQIFGRETPVEVAFSQAEKI